MKNKAKVLFYSIQGEDVLVLLGKRIISSSEEFWWLPGGSSEKGESLWEGAKRELSEELFLTKEMEEAIHPAVDLPFIRYATDKSEVTVFLLKMNAASAAPDCKDEFVETKWFALEQLPENMSREFSNIQPYLTKEFLKQI